MKTKIKLDGYNLMGAFMAASNASHKNADQKFYIVKLGKFQGIYVVDESFLPKATNVHGFYLNGKWNLIKAW